MSRTTNKLSKPVIVWFYGRHDSGKTTVMKRMSEMFREGCKKYVEHKFGSDGIYVLQYGSYRIGINTRGDGIKEVAFGLERFLRLNLDVCIVCARQRFERWKSDLTKKLSIASQQKFQNFDVFEVPRWIVGSMSPSKQCKSCALLSVSAEDLFFLIVRLMKSGLPRKWPECNQNSCLYDFCWNVNEKTVW